MIEAPKLREAAAAYANADERKEEEKEQSNFQVVWGARYRAFIAGAAWRGEQPHVD